ncbi:MAG: Stk1 family PASTA domain-containing Ser/Thr kinase [Oscillospiraceae bacterium]|nr:Stk1 family PASTA domain-containing Ser/Thr kinase [Oscillospiraceae bacterium]
MDNNIGKKLDDRYELLELIGVGGMADIYKARDIVEDKIVAAKILKNELAESEDFLRRFRNESKAIALLSHPNIVKIFDVGFNDKVQFIVMEHIDGITLTEYIERQGVLKWRDALHFITQILRALQHAHDRGIVHRDIKSQNVMLLPDGTIKVMDFGIARFNRETDKTISEKAIGSVHYISPEQAKGEATDEKSDIYSVGVMLFEMLTGRKPFDGDNPVSIALMHMQAQPKKPTDINSSIPDGLEEITLKAMQKEPVKRYQTAGEMINDIDEFKKNPSIIFEYKYFSTEQNAKYFDKTPSTAPIAPVPEKKSGKTEPVVKNEAIAVKNDDFDDEDDYDDYYDEVVERRSPLLSILFATASVFVIMAAWLIFTIVTGTLGESNETEGGEKISVPNFVRKDYEEVLRQYPNLNFRVEQENSNEYESGQIMWQSVQAGTSIKASQQIEIKISKGPAMVEVDNYEGGVLHVDEVTRRLKNRGLKWKMVSMESDTVPVGYVIKTSPTAGSMVEKDTVVTLWVSLGTGYGTTNVPDLLNLKKERAEEHAVMYKIVLVIVEEYNEEVDAGIVFWQEFDYMTPIELNSLMEIKVSLGPRPSRDAKIEHNISAGRTGDYRFEFYLNGELQTRLTKVQDIALNQKILWEFTGTGSNQSYAIKITSIITGKSAIFCEYIYDFTGDEVTRERVQWNDRIFSEISVPDEPVTPDPPPDDPPPDDPTDNPDPNPEDNGDGNENGEE